MDNHDSQQPEDRPISPISENEFEEDYAPSIVAPSVRYRDNDDDDDVQNPFTDAAAPDSPHDTPPITPLISRHPSLNQPTSSPRSSDLLQPPNLRLSIRKNPTQPQYSSPSPQHDPLLPIEEPHRSNSTSSLMAPQSPIDAGSGPSHPYDLYPQSLGISRTASVATTADLRTSSLRQSPRPQQPAFPYAMYPQDTSDDTPTDDSSPSFTVGFPGHAQPFHRRIGADGEEQDIIGLDGHTEQLPPYTRFPDAAIIKGPNDFGSSLPVIGEANQSLDNLVEIRRPTSDSLSTSTESHANPFAPSSATEPLNPSPSSYDHAYGHAISEKSFRQKSWKQRRHHRLCGFLPVWGLLLGLAVIVIIAAICAGVIGGYVVQFRDNHKKDFHKPETSPAAGHSSNTLIDAYPITTPTAVSLPTGTFEVPLHSPDTRFPACLPANQANAWSCDLPPSRSVLFKIYGSPNRLYLDAVPAHNATNVTYGSQPPELKSQKLRLVMDTDDKSLGAAYHFQAFYDKLVIIPDGFLSVLPSSSSAMQDSFFGAIFSRGFNDQVSFDYPPVSTGDYAWWCSWTDSFIEGFIYANPVSPDPQPTSSSFTSRSSTPTNPISYSPPLTPTTPNTSPSSDPYNTSPTMPYTPLETTDEDPTNARLLKARSTSSSAMSSSSSSRTKTSSIPVMTNIVKLEERRLQGYHEDPICTKMTYLQDFRWVPAYDESSQLVTVVLKEDDGGNWMRKYRYRTVRRAVDMGDMVQRRKSYRGDVDDTCYCQWISYVPPPAVPEQ